jgi:hypothetical protein
LATSGDHELAMDRPFCLPFSDECEVFEASWRSGLAMMLNGPTGRRNDPLVQHMAHRPPAGGGRCQLPRGHHHRRTCPAGACSRAVAGPLTRAASDGGLCYSSRLARVCANGVVQDVADPLFMCTWTYSPGGSSRSAELAVAPRPPRRSRTRDLETALPARAIGQPATTTTAPTAADPVRSVGGTECDKTTLQLWVDA